MKKEVKNGRPLRCRGRLLKTRYTSYDNIPPDGATIRKHVICGVTDKLDDLWDHDAHHLTHTVKQNIIKYAM